MTTTLLAELAPGFQDPAHDAQRCFRAVLDAMARPGRVQALPVALLAALPPGRSDGERGTAPGRVPTALALTLLDADVTLWLAPPFDRAEIRSYLGFHTGVRLAAGPGDADFVLASASGADEGLLGAMRTGTDEAPQAGATLLLVEDRAPLPSHRTLSLSGPGIQTVETLRAGAVAMGFWHARSAMQPSFPRGVDLLLCGRASIVAIPRSTRLAFVDGEA